jgi:predicted acylesterase/phospholipase RssA
VPIAAETPNKRALILPGGGIRVAYQAGIVKALHDHGLRYSFADGASGGTMNLAALLGGLTPNELCRRWRTLRVADFVSPRPLAAYARFPRMGALGDLDSIHDRVFPHLGIDAGRVRDAQKIHATFNVCNFDEKTVWPVPSGNVSEELLLAAISLPLATPPVKWHGQTWTDSVWIRDSNLLAAVEAGASELWVAWCIGNTTSFRDGLLDQYVHMIEMAAIGRLNDELAQIQQLNDRIAAGERPYGHKAKIVVHLIKPEVPLPLDPDFLTGKIDAATLIAYGYRDAHRYLATMSPNGIALGPNATRMRDPGRGVQFREVMAGRITFGEENPEVGYHSQAAMAVAIHATIDIENMRSFELDPRHIGSIAGHVELHRKGGWLPISSGIFGLFTPSNSDPKLSLMIYAGEIEIDGISYWFNGRKHVRVSGIWNLWKQTTTLYVTLHKGADETGPIVAAGVLRLGVSELVALLGTFRSTGYQPRWAGLKAAIQFFRFFASQLVRHYVTGRPA